MSVKIERLDFDSDEVIISVGFLWLRDIEPLMTKAMAHYVEAYEPRKMIYEKYRQLGSAFANFVPINKAVSGSSGTSVFQERRTKSTICRTYDDTDVISYEVDVVSMSSIIEAVYGAFGRIDKLLLNCEGSEIPIIKETPSELFALCDYIYVSFHDFMPFLNLKPADVEFCKIKLRRTHEQELICAKCFEYIYRRRK